MFWNVTQIRFLIRPVFLGYLYAPPWKVKQSKKWTALSLKSEDLIYTTAETRNQAGSNFVRKRTYIAE
jgi:hypothetical protein